MRGLAIRCGAAFLVLTTLSAGNGLAQAAPFCVRGRAPAFEPALIQLNELLGGLLGDPIECAHPDPLLTGDTVQRTTTGLASIQATTNIASFVMGSEHWQLTPGGVVYWTEPSLAAPSDQPPAAVEAALADAAARLQVDPASVQLVRFEHVDWPNSSLGCAQRAAVYLDVITPGWLVAIEADGQSLTYHTDERGRLLVC
jgi:hypothetical protein